MSARKQQAFTIVELMLIVGIVSVLMAIGVPVYKSYIDRASAGSASKDIFEISITLDDYFLTKRRFPDSLDDIGYGDAEDPWGNAYQYLNIATVQGSGRLRKDKNLVPINTDYDLYSMGPDGRSVGPLTAKASRDDIIRANDGAYVGRAEDY
tara:strand:- start:155148 stop:155603 length:456 start_codon:yes stop_codon:yes gene_type:complete